MPAIFQRLTDAIRGIILDRTPVEELLGILDDFLRIVYRREEEIDGELLKRGQIAARRLTTS